MLRPRLALLVLSGLIAALIPATPASAQTPRGLAGSISAAERRSLEKEARLIFDLLQNHHYSGKALRQVSNQDLIANYLDELDPERRFLTAEDVAYFNRRFGRSLKSVYLLKGDLQPAFEMYDVFAERLHARLDWIDSRLRNLFDFTADETFNPNEDPPKTAAERDRLWERQLKSQVLDELLAGRSSPDAREAVNETYRELRRRFAAYKTEDVRNHFLDSIIRTFDPHSGYLSADASRDFEIEMGDTLAGIGLDLRKISGRCTVVALAPGGPADLSDRISPGDVLIAMREESGPRVDLSTLPLTAIVAAMRGEAGTGLTAFFTRTGASVEFEVPLVRAKVIDPATRARGAVSVVPASDGGSARIGWIDLPAFYGSPAGGGESATRDVEELVRAMQAQGGLDGLVLDLRRNPGGALLEAVGLASLFLPSGKRVLHAGTSGGQPQEHLTADRGFRFEGPLVVLTSARSASASEILAGALRLHRRAVVVGGAATFGKGTVQSYIDLRQLVPDPDTARWGSLRLTIQHYFLPDGQPVQQVGVPSDLILPEYNDPEFRREADLPASMPPAPLASARPLSSAADIAGAWDDALLSRLKASFESRLSSLPEWTLWKAERDVFDEQAARSEWSLNHPSREKERDEHLAAFAQSIRGRQALGRDHSYKTTPFETADLEQLGETDQEHLRRRLGTRVDEDGVVAGDYWFAGRTDRGRWRRFALHDIDFTRETCFADEFAAKVREAGFGRPTPEGLRLAFHELAALQRNSLPGLRERLTEALVPVSPDKAAPALEAFFSALLESNPEWLADRRPLDVPRREALRTAAEWSVLSRGRPSPSGE